MKRRLSLDDLDIDAPMESDTAFFAANPGATERLRLSFPQEWPAAFNARWTRVRQIVPGVRMRQPVNAKTRRTSK